MTTLMRAATALALAALPLSLPASAHAVAAVPEVLPIGVAVSALHIADESRDGYRRELFKHWNAGESASDGCDTRREVLIAEAIEPPTIGPRCTLTGGSWWSYYDEQTINSANSLDIDHMVPLAEAWDSGASGWTPARREAYANDQQQASSLVAVSARSNRQKADQDPFEWLPPASDALCRYASEWTATKLRWQLAVDQDEQNRLFDIAAGCGENTVTYTPAP